MGGEIKKIKSSNKRFQRLFWKSDVCVCFIISCKLWGCVPVKRKGKKKGLNLMYGKNVRNS